MKHIPLVVAILAIHPTVHAQNFDMDGIHGSGDLYTSVETVTWFNGHQTKNSIYGDFDNSTRTTTIRYGVGERADGTPGEKFFFLFVEAPLYVKNMIWHPLWKSPFWPGINLPESTAQAWIWDPRLGRVAPLPPMPGDPPGGLPGPLKPHAPLHDRIP